MLDAFLHRKLRGLVHEAMRGPNRQELQEDLITSTVFGPLRFMPTDAAWEVVSRVLLDGRQSTGFKPSTHYLQFWPSLRDAMQSRVEPDLALIFGREGEPSRVFVLEVKWNAKLGPHQLIHQNEAASIKWNHDAFVTQILLTKCPAVGEDARLQVEATNCITTTWHRVMAHVYLIREAATEGYVGQWARLVCELLGGLSVVPFLGFHSMQPLLSVEPVRGWVLQYLSFSVEQWKNTLGQTSISNVLRWRIGR